MYNGPLTSQQIPLAAGVYKIEFIISDPFSAQAVPVIIENVEVSEMFHVQARFVSGTDGWFPISTSCEIFGSAEVERMYVEYVHVCTVYVQYVSATGSNRQLQF